MTSNTSQMYFFQLCKDNLAPQTEGGSLTNKEPTLNSALFETFHITAALFDQPRTVFSKSLNERGEPRIFPYKHLVINIILTCIPSFLSHGI